MTRHQTVFFRQILVASDVFVSALAFLAALTLRERLVGLGLPAWTGLHELGPVAGLSEYGTLLLGLAPLWAITFHATKTGPFRYGLGQTYRRYVRAVLVGLVLLVVVQFMLQLRFLSRSFVGLFVLLQLGMLMLARPAILAAVQGTRRRHDHRVLIVGRGKPAADFARSLRERSDWHNRLLGHVSVPGERAVRSSLPHVGRVEDLADILDDQPVDEVVFAVTDREHPALQAAIEACDVRGVEVLLTMPTSVPAGGNVEVASVTGFDLPMIGGGRLTAASLRGRPGVLALWSTDCSASRLALSGLAAVQEAYAARGVSVTILANDADTRMLESFMNRAGVNLPVAYAAGKLQALFGTARRPWHKGFPLPSYIVLNSAGRVTAVEIGVPLMDVQTGEVQLEHLRTALDRALTAMM